uniref:Uncharacterized protein n=1 Tax=Romanomermis culicivorax TaxID=13658 RepID=A0A915JRL5_ROMCU
MLKTYNFETLEIAPERILTFARDERGHTALNSLYVFPNITVQKRRDPVSKCSLNNEDSKRYLSDSASDSSIETCEQPAKERSASDMINSLPYLPDLYVRRSNKHDTGVVGLLQLKLSDLEKKVTFNDEKIRQNCQGTHKTTTLPGVADSATMRNCCVYCNNARTTLKKKVPLTNYRVAILKISSPDTKFKEYRVRSQQNGRVIMDFGCPIHIYCLPSFICCPKLFERLVFKSCSIAKFSNAWSSLLSSSILSSSEKKLPKSKFLAQLELVDGATAVFFGGGESSVISSTKPSRAALCFS